MDMINNIFEYTLLLMPQVLEGLEVTLKLFALTLIFSIPLGILLALGRLSRFKLVKALTSLYIVVLRGTPFYFKLYLYSLAFLL